MDTVWLGWNPVSRVRHQRELYVNRNGYRPELLPNQIVRKKDGAKYFGYRSTTLDDKIADGDNPEAD